MFVSKRIVILFGTALAIAFANCGTAEAAVPTSSDRLPPLVKETSAHFALALRMHPNEAQQRQAQLDSVVAAWRAAPRTAANDELLARWLRSAIRMSMPGQRESLPPVPEFKTSVRVEKPVTVPSPAEHSVTVPREAAPSASTGASPADEPEVEVPHDTEPHDVVGPAVADPATLEEGPSDTDPLPTIAPPTESDETTDPFRDDPLEEMPLDETPHEDSEQD